MTIDSIDTNRSNPVTSDDRGLGRRIKQRRNRIRAKRRVLDVRNRHTDLDDTTDWLLADYVQAVKDGEDRHHLSAILTGISGCLLAQSSCWYTRGYAAEAEKYRLSGLLLAEVAACASENPSVSDPPDYRGPRAPEFHKSGEISAALYELAQAYRAPQLDDEELVVWGCLSGLIEAVVETRPVMPGTWPGPVILADMGDAHFAVERPDRPEPARTLEHIDRDVQRTCRWSKYYSYSPALLALAILVGIVVWSFDPIAGPMLTFGSVPVLGGPLLAVGAALKRRLARLRAEADAHREAVSA